MENYNDVFNNLHKIEKNLEFANTDFVQWAQPIVNPTVYFPKALPTLYYINAVSAFQSALELYIYKNYYRDNLWNLQSCITYLEKRGKLDNPTEALSIKKKRNDYAHEVDKFATWDDLKQVLIDIKKELTHLHIHPTT